MKRVTPSDTPDATTRTESRAHCLQGQHVERSVKKTISAGMNHDGRVTAADALELVKVSAGVNNPIQISFNAKLAAGVTFRFGFDGSAARGMCA